MAPKYKLTYFPITGLGEPIRFLLAYGNNEFEDIRLTYKDWPQTKKTMPFGRVPILEVDGKLIHQSGAICRYLAKQLNLAGRDDWESLQTDIINDTFNDFYLPIAAYYYDPNEAARKEKYGPLMKETIPFYLSKFDKIVAENGGYFVGGRLSWADFRFVGMIGYFEKLVDMDMYKDYPNLTRLRETVYNIPQIKKWIEKRPDDIIFKFEK